MASSSSVSEPFTSPTVLKLIEALPHLSSCPGHPSTCVMCMPAVHLHRNFSLFRGHLIKGHHSDLGHVAIVPLDGDRRWGVMSIVPGQDVSSPSCGSTRNSVPHLRRHFGGLASGTIAFSRESLRSASPQEGTRLLRKLSQMGHCDEPSEGLQLELVAQGPGNSSRPREEGNNP